VELMACHPSNLYWYILWRVEKEGNKYDVTLCDEYGRLYRVCSIHYSNYKQEGQRNDDDDDMMKYVEGGVADSENK